MLQNVSFQEKFYASQDGLKLYYRDYGRGSSTKTPLVCLHGLTRNSRDYHRFASHFSEDRHIFSLDIRGRGRSEYDKNYKNYQIPTYVQDILTFLDYEKLDQAIIVGTSMGGIIAMVLGTVQPARLKAIILNDIGPEIDQKGMDRIGSIVDNKIIEHDWQKVVENVRARSSFLFPDYNDQDWERFTRDTYREQPDGTIIADYDPAIGIALQESASNIAPVDMWPMFKALAPIPILALRGENSDILSNKTLKKMAKCHPNLVPLIIPNRAHVPDLTEATSIQGIKNFIRDL